MARLNQVLERVSDVAPRVFRDGHNADNSGLWLAVCLQTPAIRSSLSLQRACIALRLTPTAARFHYCHVNDETGKLCADHPRPPLPPLPHGTSLTLCCMWCRTQTLLLYADLLGTWKRREEEGRAVRKQAHELAVFPSLKGEAIGGLLRLVASPDSADDAASLLCCSRCGGGPAC